MAVDAVSPRSDAGTFGLYLSVYLSIHLPIQQSSRFRAVNAHAHARTHAQKLKRVACKYICWA